MTHVWLKTSIVINFSAKITTNKKDIASSDLKIYNDISDVEDIEILLWHIHFWQSIQTFRLNVSHHQCERSERESVSEFPLTPLTLMMTHVESKRLYGLSKMDMS